MTRPKAGVWAETSVLTIAVFIVLAGWSLTTPLFSTVDESRHVNSIIRLMDGGGWPEPKTAPMLEATELAAREAGHPIAGPLVPGAKQAAGTAAAAPDGPVSPDERSSLAGVHGAPAGIVPHLDWMNQHPPGYYALLAGPLDLVGADDWRWDHLVLTMRLLSCLLTAAAVPFVAGAGRLLSGSRAAGIVAGSTVLLVPQWFNTSSLVTNDSLLLALGAALLYAGVRAVTRPQTLVSSSLLGGVVLGVGLLTKGLMLAAIPVLAVFLLVAGWRAGPTWRQRFWTPLGSGVLAFAIGGWWWVRNLIVLGSLQPSVYGSGRNADPDPGYSLSGYVAQAARRLVRTFWGSSRESLTLPVSVLAVATVAALVVVVAGLVTSRQRLALALTFLYPALVCAITLQHSWEIFWNLGRIQGVQGRYLFGGITALAGCVASVWVVVLRHRGLGRVAAAGWAALVLVVPLGAWAFTLHRRWPDGLRQMLDQGAVPTFVPGLVAAAALLALVSTAVLTWRRTNQEIAAGREGVDEPSSAV